MAALYPDASAENEEEMLEVPLYEPKDRQITGRRLLAVFLLATGAVACVALVASWWKGSSSPLNQVGTDVVELEASHSTKMRWRAFPEKCVVAKAGQTPYINDCDGSADEEFWVPVEGKTGKITLKTDTTLCLCTHHDSKVILHVHSCDDSDYHCTWVNSPKGQGRIHLAHYDGTDDERCLDIPNRDTTNGRTLQVWSCKAGNYPIEDIAFYTNCAFEPWQEWGACSAACGGGTHTRTRKQGHASWSGDLCSKGEETGSCDAGACDKGPKDGSVGPYSGLQATVLGLCLLLSWGRTVGQ